MAIEVPNGSEIARIEDLAHEVRRDFETGRAYSDRLLELYIKYSPALSDAIAFFGEARDLFPTANCGLATLALKDRIGKGVISQDTYYRHPDCGIEYHTVLELDSGIIVDITSDQFGGPKVYIGPLREPWQRIQFPS